MQFHFAPVAPSTDMFSRNQDKVDDGKPFNFAATTEKHYPGLGTNEKNDSGLLLKTDPLAGIGSSKTEDAGEISATDPMATFRKAAVRFKAGDRIRYDGKVMTVREIYPMRDSGDTGKCVIWGRHGGGETVAIVGRGEIEAA